jgi:hypothetical protein
MLLFGQTQCKVLDIALTTAIAMGSGWEELRIMSLISFMPEDTYLREDIGSYLTTPRTTIRFKEWPLPSRVEIWSQKLQGRDGSDSGASVTVYRNSSLDPLQRSQREPAMPEGMDHVTEGESVPSVISSLNPDQIWCSKRWCICINKQRLWVKPSVSHDEDSSHIFQGAALIIVKRGCGADLS